MTSCSHYQPALPAALYRAADVRELDRRAIEDHGIPGSQLMERAGAAAYAAVCEDLDDNARLTVSVGGGNNGGDGFVMRTAGAAQAGWSGPAVAAWRSGQPQGGCAHCLGQGGGRRRCGAARPAPGGHGRSVT
ncbi:MAG: NAD(P)H-hydrate epimerase [Gammaproteobacteria bacterium]|nr:NAD(P)H-hydrate epimerase [Gammaproteobacteria bacterium]